MLRLHLYENVFETDDFNKAKRLAALLNQELVGRLMCNNCQRGIEIPIDVIERMPADGAGLITPDKDGGVWHPIYKLECNTEEWLCHDCWLQYLALLRFPDDSES